MSSEYSLFCITDNRREYVWSDTPPTHCPVNAEHEIESLPPTLIRKRLNKIIIAQTGLGDFITIDDALASINGATNVIFQIYPGTYIVNNPIILPEGTVFEAVGTSGNTIVVASNPNADVIILSKWCKIYGLHITGAYGTGSRGIYFNGSTGTGAVASVEQCFISDCDIGMEANGGPDILYSSTTIIFTRNININKALYAHNSGFIITSNMLLSGSYTGQNTIFNAAYVMDQGSKISMTTSSIYFCGNALYVDNNGFMEITLMTINYTGTGLVIGSNNTGSIVRLSSVNVLNSIQYDLSILSTNADISIHSSQLDENKINNPNDVIVNANFQYLNQNKKFMTYTGDIKFGTVSNPTVVSFGEGRYDTSYNIILSNNNLDQETIWIENTDAAANDDGITFNLFQKNEPGYCCYIGASHPILGVKICITTATINPVSMDDVIWEYWNGNNWIQFNIMQLYASSPYYCYTINSCISVADKFQIRFGLTTTTPFVLKTIDDFTAYWIRLRIINTIPSIPVCEYIKVHVSQTEINSDGFIEHFGNARTVGKLSWNFDNGNGTTNYPINQDIFLSKNIIINKKTNAFLQGVLSRISMVGRLASDIDISFPVKLKFSFLVDNNTSGNILWTIRTANTQNNNNVYTNLNDAPIDFDPAYTDTFNIVTTIPENKAYKELRETFSIDVDKINVNPRPDDGVESLLWISIERDATETNVNDTFDGSVFIIEQDIHYIKWCDGDHVLSY